jgi:hypothetical protein
VITKGKEGVRVGSYAVGIPEKRVYTVGNPGVWGEFE